MGTSTFVTPKVFRTRLKSLSWQDCWQRDFKKVIRIKFNSSMAIKQSRTTAKLLCLLTVSRFYRYRDIYLQSYSSAFNFSNTHVLQLM